ncbi:hypothetical protein [Streptomyces sp. NPDC057877]|uniref:hypothetical protein n=1 Tax=Streptomyces sp. NPDC057877 TaxID=3346269 RepID=UPI00368AB00A
MLVRRGESWSARQLASVVTALVLSWLVVWWCAPGAAAGGPTSALVVSPESRETAALYYSDKEYAELDRLLGERAGGSAERPSDSELVRSRQINVTWMVHDIDPWRMSRVHVPAGGSSLWIHTSTNPPQWTGAWHRAKQPAELRALLERLGVMGTAKDPAAAPPAPESTETAAAGQPGGTVTASPSLAAASATDGRGGGDDGWWWALPGAAAGAVLALLLRPLAVNRSHRPRPEPGPRQELRDV